MDASVCGSPSESQVGLIESRNIVLRAGNTVSIDRAGRNDPRTNLCGGSTSRPECHRRANSRWPSPWVDRSGRYDQCSRLHINSHRKSIHGVLSPELSGYSYRNSAGGLRATSAPGTAAPGPWTPGGPRRRLSEANSGETRMIQPIFPILAQASRLASAP